MNRWTELVHFDPSPGDPLGPNATPIYQTATFAQPSADGCGRYDYTRSGNPTRSVLQERLAKLEGTQHAFAFTSGMAAISAVTRLLSAGDHLLAGSDLYGGTYRLLSKVLSRQGISVTHVDTTDLDKVRASFTDRTRLVLTESPTNPLQRITDLAALADICHARGAKLAIDNTLVSPWLQRPAEHGVDLVVHSATKHLSGHSDVMAGVVCTSDAEIAEAIGFIQNAEGAALAPFDSWLLLRGLQTLPLRLERQQSTAQKLAEFLAEHHEVRQVHYPGLSSHPGHALHRRQARGPGALISFETGDRALSQRVVEAASLFTISVSFGSLHSLISLPCRMSHASIPDAERTLPGDLVRISVGIEDPDDLIGDLDHAFRRAHCRDVRAVNLVERAAARN